MAKRKYLAFDIEIAKALPEDVEDLKSHRPLGICCAAALAVDDDVPHLWYSRNPDGSPAPRLSQSEASDLVAFLAQQANEGLTIVTWNGLCFDFDILAEESGRYADCQELAMDHVDLMFHVFCEKGFAVGLDAAAKGIGLQGKTPGVNAAFAPQLWAAGDHARVLEYVTNDCRLTLSVADVSEHEQSFVWVTKRGTTSNVFLGSGWSSVRKALKMPEPDTSWMTSAPLPRSRFTDWFKT